MSDPFTITLLTPLGRGAVATISVDGAASIAAVRQLFRPTTPQCDLAIGRILVGHWQSSEAAVEEVVVCRRRENRIEVNCHGGQAACQAILASLTRLGGVLQNAQSWLDEQPFTSDERAARLALQHASTPRVAGILLDQFRGALRTAIQESVRKFEGGDIDGALQQIQKMLGNAELGRHLTKPWRVVIVGPPNVGKSSLLNALVGYERAIVYDEPGTTRDVLRATTALEGWPVELIDTAGLRETSDAIEAQGVSRAQTEMENADLILVVTDHQTNPRDLRQWRVANEKSLLVANKADLILDDETQADYVRTSAKTGLGWPELLRTIVHRLVPAPPAPGDAVPFTPEQVEALKSIAEAIQQGGSIPYRR